MKSLGIIRNIDDLGRVTIPKELRQSQGWDKGQPMEMFVEGNKLVMQAYRKEEEKEQTIASLVSLLASENEAVKQIARNTIEFIQRG